MELGLNSFWICLSLVFVGSSFWSLTKSHPEFCWSKYFRTIPAKVCLLTLLLPFVSITDDLAATQRLREHKHGSRHSAKQVMEGDDSNEVRKVPVPVSSLPTRFHEVRDQRLLGTVRDSNAPSIASFITPQHQTRAPPSIG